jgi:hypothetical protein
MATRRPSTPAKAAAAEKPARTARAASAPDAGAAASSSRSLGLAETLLIFSTIMLIAAILMTDNYLGKQFGEGMFFKG